MIPSQPLEWDHKLSDVSMAAYEIGSLGDMCWVLVLMLFLVAG